MKTTRRSFIQASALVSIATAQLVPADAAVPAKKAAARGELDGFAIAREHTILRDIPGPSFLEGMLLGNGDVGVCAVVRPDALGLHIGKNDCWDIRVSEDSQDPVLPFAGVLDLWRRASEEAKKQGQPDMIHMEEKIDFLRDYTKKAVSRYRTKWPRPWPCGTVWINWDARWVEPIAYRLDPSNGLFTLDLSCTSPEGKSATVRMSAFVDWESGLVSVSTTEPLAVLSVVFSPEVDGFRVGPFDAGHLQGTPDLLPPPETKVHAGDTFAEISSFQFLPALGPTKETPTPPKSELDRNVSLVTRLPGRWSVGTSKIAKDISLLPKSPGPLRVDIQVATPRDILLDKLEREAQSQGRKNAAIAIPQTHAYSADERDTMNFARARIERLAATGVGLLQKESEAHWREFWSRSAVRIENAELESLWYRNQYFLACCLRNNKVGPGLFANWSAGDIGVAWHGDYHADYNSQQVYWSVFSSNHAEMHGPYIELCENLRAMSEKFAREKIGLPGACFPLSSFPVASQQFPYPAPPWAYQVSMTPWTVQSLWWHYLYTQDEEELRRVYPLLRTAAQYVTAYVRKEADQKYHVFPTVSSENWGFTADFRLNKDCILDLALIQFLLDAVIEGSTILGLDGAERLHWAEVRANLAPYPKTRAARGDVWLDVTDAPADYVYNIPITLAPVFPGEQVGLDGGPFLETAQRTARSIRLEGGNDLVYQPLIRARLGMLDLEWFLREVKYCSLPNGAANDRIRQSGGGYAQSADFDFMMPMGVWCENFALPVVLNECMLQSYSGTLRVFPNTTNLGPASFKDLRAVGAFLVSAAYDGHTVKQLSIFSEKGKTLRLVLPWKGKGLHVTRSSDKRQVAVKMEADVCTFETEPGQHYQLASA
jgi:alpha-L-fucosidase 2